MSRPATRPSALWSAWAGPLLAVTLPVLGLAAQGVVNPSLLGPLPRDDQPGGFAEVLRERASAVVHVFVEVDGPRTAFKIQRPSTGVLVSRSGLVLTHRDLVLEAKGADDKQLKVQLHGVAAPVDADLIAEDVASGLALLRIEPRPSLRLRPAPLAAAAAQPGQPVVVASFHDGVERVAYGGVAMRASLGVKIGGAEQPAEDLVLTDAKIQRRNHGAGLFDLAGNLVGLVSAEHVLDAVQEPTLADLKRPSFGFAIAAHRIRAAFADDVREQGLALDGAPEGTAERLGGASARAVAAVADAVVGVSVREQPDGSGWDDPVVRQRRDGLGSGVRIAPDLVLTNAHIVRGHRQVWVRRDDEQVRASVLAEESAANLALLQLERTRFPGEPATLASAADARPGFAVVGVGRPLGRALAVTAGVVSARRGRDRLQADPSLGNHTAGGAIVDGLGRLIGIADGGVVDPVDLAFAQRGDEAPVDTDLYLFPTTDFVWRLFKDELAPYVENDPAFGELAAASAAERAELFTGDDPVAATDGALLNVYVSRAAQPAAASDNPFAAHAEPRVIPRSLGSGVIIDGSGLALSNWHVVDDATDPDGSMRPDHAVHARLRDGTKYDVEVLSISREDDLALLRLKLPEGGRAAFVALGDSDAMQLGERVVAIGNPLGNANTVTSGVLSAVDQEINVKGRWAKFEGLLEPDAAINGGNSGGALLDGRGRLVGINSAGGRGFGASGYAIPVNHVRQQVLELLMSPAKLRSPWLGLTPAHDLGKGVGVAAVDPLGPAAAAGIEVGDRLLAADGVELTWSVGWVMHLLRAPLDQAMALTVHKPDGSQRELSITPWAPEAWGVWKQAQLRVETFAMQDDTKLVQAAATALHRQFSGDPTATPTRWPQSLVRVVGIHPELDRDEVDVREGDILLAVELKVRGRDGNASSLLRMESVAALQRCFNDPQLGSYDGVEFPIWLFREGAVRKVNIPARRLML